MRGKSMKRMLWLCGFAFLMAHSPCGAALDGQTIKWGRPIDLGPGGYARIHRLADGRFMASGASRLPWCATSPRRTEARRCASILPTPSLRSSKRAGSSTPAICGQMAGGMTSIRARSPYRRAMTRAERGRR